MFQSSADYSRNGAAVLIKRTCVRGVKVCHNEGLQTLREREKDCADQKTGKEKKKNLWCSSKLE